MQVKDFGHNSATMLSNGDQPYINQTEYTAATTFVSNAGASAVVDVIIMLGTNDSKSYNWAPTAGSTRAAQFMTDCAAMVDHFTGLATHPVVYLALPPAIYTNSFGISETVTVDAGSIRSSSRWRCRRGCRSSTFTRRQPVTPKTSRTAFTRPTRGTCSSRR